MSSMHTGLEDSKSNFGRLSEFYKERAENEVGLIITGGFSPNIVGWAKPFSGRLTNKSHVRDHKEITDTVHKSGGKIALQILHTGRYGYHPFTVAPSNIKSPISPFTPWELSSKGVEKQINHYVRCAQLAREAGYDGIEIMGSEGYLINQFLVEHTNKRTDEWGGSFQNRMRFPVEITKRTREAVGRDFIIIYRISLLDLVPNGQNWDETVRLAKNVEAAGANILNTGIGWHEARIPTITTSVPRAAFTWLTQKLKKEIAIPIAASNRINMPEVAEQILEDDVADLISMARPFLADPEFVKKAKENRANEINTCIACNQACLDHVFENKIASCLVNPKACHETEFKINTTNKRKRIAVVGAGPAGMSCSTSLAEHQHEVHLYDKADEIGGQLNMAKQIPGKEEFYETLRYFKNKLLRTGVNLHLKTEVKAETIIEDGFDDVVIATGVTPRDPKISGQNNSKVLSYIDVLRHKNNVGKRVAIIGAGGIGFDVAEYLTEPGPSNTLNLKEWLNEWGIESPETYRGGLAPSVQHDISNLREVWLLQRKDTKVGKSLNKTTGWIHRTTLKKRGVHMLNNINYEEISDKGIRISTGKEKDNDRWLEVDNIIICAGQLPFRELLEPLEEANINTHVIGGAYKAGELDAKFAIDQGARLALTL